MGVISLCGSEMYCLLTVERGWPDRRYAAWLAESLYASLVAPAAIS